MLDYSSGITVKSINGLSQALRSRASIAITLKSLNLSDNFIKGEECEVNMFFI